MGGDGGSIPQRADMVKTKGYTTSSRGSMGFNPNGFRRVVDEGHDLRKQRQTRMQTCALTGKPLTKPIVACRCGFLFNKDEVLSKLLDKSMPDKFSHITSLKDLVDCHFEMSGATPVCPVTRRELDDGVAKAEVAWPCGCVVSEKALGLKAKDDKCMVCGKRVDLRTKLAPDEADLEQQREVAMAMRKKRPIASDARKAESANVVSSKRLRPTETEHASAMEQYAKSDALSQLFHDSKKVDKTDAFGRSYSRRY